ncbi:RCC1 domain-containing protein 1 [Halocaridina rubra]|uniref:RCC1 domain-containing protein 1 n=1 Tax=Halocaridina rubra TaxID=373956 RepID=A0AAN9AE42_HALRR
MMIFGCGNNISQQICRNEETAIFCCPVPILEVADPVEVHATFSHILWKTENNWEMTGFKGSGSSVRENIPVNWKVAVSENRLVGLTDFGTVMLFEKKRSWRKLHFQPYLERPVIDRASQDQNIHKVDVIKDWHGVRAVKECSDAPSPSENSGQSKNSEVSDTTKEIEFEKISCEDNRVLCLDKEGVLYTGNVPLPVLGHKFTDIAVGKEHNVALTAEGIVFTWGSGMRGQLGNGEICQNEQPTPVHGLRGIMIKSITCGGWHSVVISDCDDAYVWGWNESGQLGLPTKAYHEEPPFKSFEYSCMCSLKSQFTTDSHVPDPDIASDKQRQDNIQSSFTKQLTKLQKEDPRINKDHCKEDVNVQASPVLLDFWCEGVNIRKVTCGDRHSLFLLDDGSAWAAGMNKYGQLGLGHTKPQNEPGEISLKNVIDIYAGGWNSIFITSI